MYFLRKDLDSQVILTRFPWGRHNWNVQVSRYKQYIQSRDSVSIAHLNVRPLYFQPGCSSITEFDVFPREEKPPLSKVKGISQLTFEGSGGSICD